MRHARHGLLRPCPTVARQQLKSIDLLCLVRSGSTLGISLIRLRCRFSSSCILSTIPSVVGSRFVLLSCCRQWYWFDIATVSIEFLSLEFPSNTHWCTSTTVSSFNTCLISHTSKWCLAKCFLSWRVLIENFSSLGNHDPSTTSGNKSVKSIKLSNSETSSIKVLVNAYREAASYLSRSADELEQLLWLYLTYVCQCVSMSLVFFFGLLSKWNIYLTSAWH